MAGLVALVGGCGGRRAEAGGSGRAGRSEGDVMVRADASKPRLTETAGAPMRAPRAGHWCARRAL